MFGYSSAGQEWKLLYLKYKQDNTAMTSACYKEVRGKPRVNEALSTMQFAFCGRNVCLFLLSAVTTV
jgi:hypothetical protein